jgi:hypothetical protein
MHLGSAEIQGPLTPAAGQHGPVCAVLPARHPTSAIEQRNGGRLLQVKRRRSDRPWASGTARTRVHSTVRSPEISLGPVRRPLRAGVGGCGIWCSGVCPDTVLSCFWHAVASALRPLAFRGPRPSSERVQGNTLWVMRTNRPIGIAVSGEPWISRNVTLHLCTREDSFNGRFEKEAVQ